MTAIVLNDIVFCLLLVNGELFAAHSSLASGALITTIVNSFVVSMYLRIPWYMALHTEPFRSMNSLHTYGDDNVNGTDCESFTFNLVKETLSHFGVVYTPSSKMAGPAPDFISIDEVSFLKRKFRCDVIDGVDCVLCPLEEASLSKMLSFTDCSKDIEDSVLLNNLIDAHKQYWFYGKDVFLARRAMLERATALAGFTVNIYDPNVYDRPPRVDEFLPYDEISKTYLSGKIQVQFS
jgi:hypothetical protein